MIDPTRCLAAQQRLRGWLLGPAVQLATGPQRGGVAGLLDARGQPQYVYAEITGYYLHWLASLPQAATPARAAAAAALDWLRCHYAEPAPATRAYLGTDPPADWRNRCRFLFDLGMVVGGIAAATRRGLVAAPQALLDQLHARASEFLEPDGSLAAIRGDAVESRWSTRPGPYQAKPASRILAADALRPLPGALRAACVATLRLHAPQAGRPGHAELHPALYHLEGVACAERPDWPAIGATLDVLLRLDDGDGRLPEVAGGDLRRLDVSAQALRIGLLLRSAGHDAPDDATLARLAGLLAAAVDPAGGIAFRSDRPGPERNVWCAMFAEQALGWYVQWRAHGDAGAAADALV